MQNSLHHEELDLDRSQIQCYSPLNSHSIMGSNPVSVCCRLKPLLIDQEKAIVQVNMKEHVLIISEQSKQITKTFAFDEIFDQTVCQHKFTRTICDPLIQFLKKGGLGGLIFSYGVTNSGKTHSILGNIENPGVLYYLIKKLQEQFGNGSVKITAFQLYNDEFFSLKNRQKMTPKQFCGFLQFDEYQPDKIQTENMETILKEYMNNRSQGDTKFNPKSSRSHAIFKIECKDFKIGVVDLAGSQRSRAKPGEKINQTISINKSLLLLGRCIQALKDKKKNPNVRIPFRQSKLTQVLMQYFTTGFKIRIIANINQAKAFYYENIQVLEYTSIAKSITNNCSSQFAQAVKSARKKYQMIKSNFKSQKQKSNLKSEFKAKVKIDQTDVIITEETFQNEHRDTQLRRILILSQKDKVEELSQRKKLAEIKSKELLQDIYITQKAFSMFLDFQHQKQAQEDRKFLSNLKKVNFFESERKNDKFADTGINTIQDMSFLLEWDKKKLISTNIKAQQNQSQKQEQVELKIQQNQEIAQNLSQAQLKTSKSQQLDQFPNQIVQLSQEDNDFLAKSFRSIANPVSTILQSGKKFFNNAHQSFKKVTGMINVFKSNIKERKTNMKARRFNFHKSVDIVIKCQKQQNQGQQNKEQNCNKQLKNKSEIEKKVECQDQYVQTIDFIPQKPYVKFKEIDHSGKKKSSSKKQNQNQEFSVDRKKILKNKTPLKYIPPTPVAKRTRHVRKQRYN